MSRRFHNATGALAMNPRALTMDLPEGYTPPPNRTVGPAVVVEIMGPLDHHASPDCDSYDAIHERVAAACASPSSVVVLKIDSPGGDVSGCFDTAREIRAMLTAAGKRSATYVDGQASSAAYALATSTDEIVVPETGCVGSIGVIAARLDLTALDAAMGQRITLVTSGARKADGNPHTTITDAELAEAQTTVDALAAIFFKLVKERRGLDAAPLQARVMHGAAAVAAGLADRVASFDQLIRSFSTTAPTEGAPMATYEEAVAALKAAAEGDGEEAAAAKRMLAAMAAKDEESDGDEEPESDESAEHQEPDGDEPEAQAVSASTAAGLAAQVQALAATVSRLTAGKASSDRDAFLASRPDLPAALVTVLKDKPLAEIQAIVSAMPRPRTKVPAAPASANPTATRQAPAPEGAVKLSEDEEMDRAMGLRSDLTGIRRVGASVEYGIMSKAEARKRIAEGKV